MGTATRWLRRWRRGVVEGFALAHADLAATQEEVPRDERGSPLDETAGGRAVVADGDELPEVRGADAAFERALAGWALLAPHGLGGFGRDDVDCVDGNATVRLDSAQRFDGGDVTVDSVAEDGLASLGSARTRAATADVLGQHLKSFGVVDGGTQIPGVLERHEGCAVRGVEKVAEPLESGTGAIEVDDGPRAAFDARA